MRTPCGWRASSSATQRVKWSMPALAAQYSAEPAIGAAAQPGRDVEDLLRARAPVPRGVRKAARQLQRRLQVDAHRCWPRRPARPDPAARGARSTPALLISVALSSCAGSWAPSQARTRSGTAPGSDRSAGHCCQVGAPLPARAAPARHGAARQAQQARAGAAQLAGQGQAHAARGAGQDVTKPATGCCSVCESTEPVAPTLPMATVASAPAVQPRLAWKRCSASRVLKT
jgi:hypothetical protein